MSTKMFYASLATFTLAACQPTIAPVEQVEKVQQVQTTQPTKPETAEAKVSVAKKQTAVQYQCKDELLVKVNKPKAKKSSSRNGSVKSIIVTYQNSSHTLSPTVSKNGKQYSNIRWVWQEFFDGSSELRDNSGTILATQCYPQQ